jgi:hypothetical protein
MNFNARRWPRKAGVPDAAARQPRKRWAVQAVYDGSAAAIITARYA